MNVREVINIALRLIGYSIPTIVDSGDDQFNNNVRQLQLIVDGLRNRYPYKVSQDINVGDISTAKFVSIDSMVSFPIGAPNGTPRLPMRSYNLQEYNQLNINPNIKGWPQGYYLQLPYTIKVWPLDTGYTVSIVGKINSALGLTSSTELDPSPLFFQNYLTISLAKVLAPYYKKTWTIDMQTALTEAQQNLDQNTDNDFSFESKGGEPNGIWRVRYLLGNG